MLGERVIWFDMCGLAVFREVLGLDMRFLGGKREKQLGVTATAIESGASGDGSEAESEYADPE
jgi:hypothetical protein